MHQYLIQKSLQVLMAGMRCSLLVLHIPKGIKALFLCIKEKICICVCHHFTIRSQNWQPPMKQDAVPAVGFQVNGGFPSSSSSSPVQPRFSSGFQNQINRPATSFRMPYSPQQCNPAAINTEDPGAQSQSRRWNFRSTGPSGSGMSAKVKKDTSQERINPQHQVCVFYSKDSI